MTWRSRRLRKQALRCCENDREVLAYHGWEERETPDPFGQMTDAVSFQFIDTRASEPRFASAVWSHRGFVGGFFYGKEGPAENPAYINDPIRFKMEATRPPDDVSGIEVDEIDDEDDG